MSSILENVTVEQFKEYFYRDFPFLPYYDEDKTYWLNDIVFNDDDQNFYQSLIDDNTNAIDDTESWKKVKGNKYDYVADEDIIKAMTQAIQVGNERFGETCTEKVNIYLHLIAFYLVMDLKNAATGVNSSFSGTVQSKSVGDVSESYAIPQWVNDNPMYSIFTQNGYGLKYLSLIAPYLAITIMFSPGRTTIG